MHARDMQNVCLQTCGSNRICEKNADFARVNTSIFIRIKNAKFSRYDF